MNQSQSYPEKIMCAVIELFDEEEIDVFLAPDTIELLTRDVQRVLEQLNISLQEVYEIEIVRPFE